MTELYVPTYVPRPEKKTRDDSQIISFNPNQEKKMAEI